MTHKFLDIPFEIKAGDINEDGTFSGWGSLFDAEPDAHRDLVARGAFTETLSKGGRNKTGIAMLWQHRNDKIPGVWTELREDPKGLFVRGQLALNTQLGREVYEIMKLGAKTGMWRFSLSIGYDSLEHEYKTIKVGDADIQVRVLKKVELWEVSIVSFPAKIGATVINVKQFIESMKDAKTERDIEKCLRDSGVFSKSDALSVISILKASLRDSNSDNSDNSDNKNEKSVTEIVLGSIRQTRKDLDVYWAMSRIHQDLRELNSKPNKED